MSGLLLKTWAAVRVIFAPELAQRRRLDEGFAREGVHAWAGFTLLGAVYLFLLAGLKVQAPLPQGQGIEWGTLHLAPIPWAIAIPAYLFISGLCFYPKRTSFLLGVAFGLYYLYGSVNGSALNVPWVAERLTFFRFPDLPFYAYHHFLPLFIFFTSLLVFIYYPASGRSPRDRLSATDIALCALTVAFTIEYIYNFVERGDRAGVVLWNDVVFGTFAAIVALESCRRVLGLVLPLVGVFFFLYGIWGPYFPEGLAHKGFSYNGVIAFLYSEEGVYGVIANVYATFVFLFILFSAFLQRTRVGDVFVDLAFSLVGRLKGGAAKSSVVSSGMVGSVVGSGAANIVITGAFTIPLMKRSGYRPQFAAAVEAVSSIGGHLMPPIMASAAFLLAAFTETKYVYVALISLVPALLYYLSVYMSVHYEACKQGIVGLPKEELPDFWGTLRKDGILLLPVAILIMLLIVGYSPFFAAFWSIVSALLFSALKKETRLLQVPALLRYLGGTAPRREPGGRAPGAEQPELWSAVRQSWGLLASVGLFVALLAWGHSLGFALFWLIGATLVLSSPKILDALVEGALNSLVVGATAGVMGLVLAGVTMPGLALKFSQLVLSYSYGMLPLALLLCAIASYILGMGMTITASYILLSILAVPALIELGVPELPAHLIILWLSQDASLTPPFALAAFIAAGLAGTDPMRTGFISLRLAKPLYVIPLLMAYTPILMNGPWTEVVVTWAGAALGFICSSAALEGYLLRRLAWWERLVLAGAAFGLFWPGYAPKMAGVTLMAFSLYVQRARPVPAQEVAPLPEASRSP
ncbi:MAG: TRAP transporter permease [Nitrospinota bacterium]